MGKYHEVNVTDLIVEKWIQVSSFVVFFSY
jgi:hypothetical protein